MDRVHKRYSIAPSSSNFYSVKANNNLNSFHQNETENLDMEIK